MPQQWEVPPQSDISFLQTVTVLESCLLLNQYDIYQSKDNWTIYTPNEFFSAAKWVVKLVFDKEDFDIVKEIVTDKENY